MAGGHGAFEPKKLPDYDMTAWEGRGAHYLVGSKSEFEGKRVVIIGGGDSACDWVVNLLDTAERVSLVHRREGFRAHEATVKEVMDAHAEGRIDLHVPYQVRDVVGNGTVEGVQLFHSEDPDSVVDVPVRRDPAPARVQDRARARSRSGASRSRRAPSASTGCSRRRWTACGRAATSPPSTASSS